MITKFEFLFSIICIMILVGVVACILEKRFDKIDTKLIEIQEVSCD